MRPAALFVDCYGTLVAGDRPVIETVCHTAAELAGVEPERLDRAWWQRFRTLCAQRTGPDFGSQRHLELEAMTDVLRDFGASPDPKAIIALLQPLFHYWRTAEPFADALDLLRDWTDCPVIIVSNIDRDDLDRVLAGLPPVAGAVTSQDARAYKPDPAVFRHALGLTGLAADRVLHVGDSWESDVCGAAAAGIPAVWLNRGAGGPPAGASDPPWVRTLADLPGCIAALPDPPSSRPTSGSR